jgi:hypothetical protein
VDKFLEQHGDEPIQQLIISRNVISPFITGILNIISPNFKKKNNNNPLYHLQLLIKTDRTSLSVEKNSRITISRYQMNKGAENMNVNVPNGLSMNILLANTRPTYSAQSNNCGHFVMGMLRSSNLSNPSNTLFVEQITAHLFTPELRKIKIQ